MILICFQKIGANEWAFYRPRWGAFHDTKLETVLRARGISTLVVCGLNYVTGVRATVYEASARDFRIIVVPDATCGAEDQGVRDLARLGVYLMDSHYFADWLGEDLQAEAA